MNIQKITAFFLAAALLFPAASMTGLAAEDLGISVTASQETVRAGESVTLTVSLAGYDETAEAIQGIQIDVTGIDPALLTVSEDGCVSLIGDTAVTSNQAFYLKDQQLLRLIYLNETGSLDRRWQDALKLDLKINPGLTEAGSIPIDVTAKIQTEKSGLEVRETLSIAYTPGRPSTVNEYVRWYEASMNLEDIISPNFYFRLDPTVFAGFTAGNNIGLQMWTAEDYAALGLAAGEQPGFDAVPTRTITEVKKNGGYWMANTGGIPAKNMADYQYVRAYAVAADGVTHYTSAYQFSAQKYARYHYGSSDQNMRALAIALMNYGAAAQRYFGYNETELMNAFLAPEDQAVDFASAVLEPRKEAVTSKFTFTVDGRVTGYETTAVLEGRIRTNAYYRIDPTLMEGGQAQLLYWHEDDYARVQTLTLDNCTGQSQMQKNNGYYYGSIPGRALKDLGDTFFLCARVVDANGVEHYSKLSRFSTHAYCQYHADHGDDPEMVDLAKALAVYSHAAKVYFDNR